MPLTAAISLVPAIDGRPTTTVQKPFAGADDLGPDKGLRHVAAVVLLFSLAARGQIKLRTIDGWQKIATVFRESMVAAR